MIFFFFAERRAVPVTDENSIRFIERTENMEKLRRVSCKYSKFLINLWFVINNLRVNKNISLMT